MPPSRVRIPPSPLRSTERCPSGLRSATGNRVRAERCVAGSNPALSARSSSFTPSGGGKGGRDAENERAGSPLIPPRHLKPVCGYPRRVSPFRDEAEPRSHRTARPLVPPCSPGSRRGGNRIRERDLRQGLKKRRGRDLNPRRTQEPETVFETAAFDRSATPPSGEGGIRTLDGG